MMCNQFKNLLEETYLQSFWKITAMLVILAQTISSKYYILLFALNLIITIVDILLAYSTICSDLFIVFHQARELLPEVVYRCTFSRLEVLGQGFQTLTNYSSKKWNLDGPHYASEKGFNLESISIWKGSLSCQKRYVKKMRFWPWTRASLYNTFLLPFPFTMDIVIWKKETYKL